MEKIFKTWKKATYFLGSFELRNEHENWAKPIDFPTVFTAYGKGIKSGRWQSCTSINTPKYVINNFFDTIGHNKHDAMFYLFFYCEQLEKINWSDVSKNKKEILELINLANAELNKLAVLD